MKNKIYFNGKCRFNEVEKTKLMDLGYTDFYELRDTTMDSEENYTVEPRVFVNNIGCLATNFEIEFKDRSDPFITIADLMKKYQPEEEKNLL